MRAVAIPISIRRLISQSSLVTRVFEILPFEISNLKCDTGHFPVPDTVPLEIIDLARHVAAAHGLEPALVCAVVEQESAWNPWAVRYEPGFLSRYVAPLYTAGKLSATEAYTRSMSWGLMQVMGQVARESGFAGQSLTELCDPETGLEFGCRILAAQLARARGDVAAALLAWNGGANSNYPSEVLARTRNYSSKRG